ncbi:hypothetical protein NIES3275_27580 [Microchaete diplosiphon NIES-3275]|nr:hypothetical protein NIES3275_27580 [Microchaete diplosiphon NIES-3275]
MPKGVAPYNSQGRRRPQRRDFVLSVKKPTNGSFIASPILPIIKMLPAKPAGIPATFVKKTNRKNMEIFAVIAGPNSPAP